jgi:predicted negative regulator of RcsB-dependent stress response
MGALETENGFWPQVVNQAGAGNPEIGKFLHAHGAGEKRGVLIRVILPESVAYLDVAITRRGDQIKGADIFSFLSGELVSQSIRRAFVVNAASQNRAIADQLKGWEHDLAANIPTLEAMTASLPAKPQEWLTTYGKLPESLRTDKNIMLTRIDVAKLATDDAFAAAVNEFKTVHAADPSTDLVLLNLYVQAQQHAEALETLKRLDTFVGGDPYLQVWKGNVLLALGKPAEARAEVTAAIKVEPTLRHGMWALVMISLAEHKYAETVGLLDNLEQTFKVEFDDLGKHPEYAEFLKSPEYNTWNRMRSAQKQPANSLR